MAIKPGGMRNALVVLLTDHSPCSHQNERDRKKQNEQCEIRRIQYSAQDNELTEWAGIVTSQYSRRSIASATDLSRHRHEIHTQIHIAEIHTSIHKKNVHCNGGVRTTF